jgi:hypothetical protein
MRAAGHDRKSELRCDPRRFPSKKFEFLTSVGHINMDVCGNFELSLQHLSHGLPTGGPVHGLEKFIRGALSDVKCDGVCKEIFFFNAERKLAALDARCVARPEHDMRGIFADRELQAL